MRENSYTFIEFCYMNKIHIGVEIQNRFKDKGLTVTEFARRINKSRENVYNIFKRKSIDTALLQKISEVLGFDFFQLFIEEKPQNLVKYEQLEKEVELLREINSLLKYKKRD